MRVAYYSPLPPERSGVADYSALLLPALRRRIDVSIARRRRPLVRRTDVALYHVGNDAVAHGWIVEALRPRPGLVVLHEVVLHHLVAGMTLGRGDAVGYVRAMERDAGDEGRALAEDVVAGRAPSPWESRPVDFPLAGEVLDLATGLIVHSKYVERRAREYGYARPIWRIPHPAWPAPEVAPAELPGNPLFGAFGHVNPSKRVPELVRAFAAVGERLPDARLVLAGSVSPRFDLERYIAPHESISHLGYVDERRLWSLIARCDVVVALREPTMGETSGIALRALALGKPLVVSDVGWFSELPHAVARRVGKHDLAAALEELGTDQAARRAMGEAAFEYVRSVHDLEHVAEAYTEAIEWTAGGETVLDSVLAEVAQAAADVEIGTASEELAEIGRRLRETSIV